MGNRGPTIMNFNDQSRSCHAERSEASLCPSRETLRCAQGDNPFPILLVKVHHRDTCPPGRVPAASLSFLNNEAAGLR